MSKIVSKVSAEKDICSSCRTLDTHTCVSWKISQATIYGDYYVRTCAVASDDGGMLVKLKAGKLFADVKFSSDKSGCKKFRQIIIPHVYKTNKVTGDIALLNVIVLSHSVHVDNVNKTLTYFP